MNGNTISLNLSRLFMILIILLGTGSFYFIQGIELMPLSEVKAGMKGEGKTIFKGSQIETFPFNVLGIIENFSPGRSMIIIEADSPVLNEAGIIEGMSGSPAYINGKLIGAISFGFSFAKKPIGGITPIEEIIYTSEYNTPPATSTPTMNVPDIKLDFSKENITLISKKIQQELARKSEGNAVSGFSPIRLIGASRGFNSQVPSYLSPVLVQGQTLKITTDKRPIISGIQDKINLKLNPADAVAIPLISGDLEYSAVGTVTHVDGQKVYAFGHPFFNMGTVDFPMHRAEVITVIPSYQSSFKLAATRELVGHIVQDRFAAVQGELGKIPYMIPMKVTLKGRNRTFKIELVNHPLLTPALAAYAMNNILTTEFQAAGLLSMNVEGKIYIEGEKNIVINDLFSGQDPFGEFSNFLLAVNYFLMNNKEKNIKIQEMDFEITGTEEVKNADIETVLIDKNAYLPGELINITVYLKNERGKKFTEDITIQAPNLKPGMEFYVMVADSQEMGNFDAKNVRSNYFPSALNFIIRAINNLRKNRNLYVKVMTAESGLFVKGYEYPKLPSSMRDLFIYDKTPIYESGAEPQTNVRYSTLYEFTSELSSVIKGSKLFKLKIKERTDD